MPVGFEGRFHFSFSVFCEKENFPNCIPPCIIGRAYTEKYDAGKIGERAAYVNQAARRKKQLKCCALNKFAWPCGALGLLFIRSRNPTPTYHREINLARLSANGPKPVSRALVSFQDI